MTDAKVQTHVVSISNNVKTGPVAAIYRTQAACPTSCPLLGNGCYAENGGPMAPFSHAKKHGKEQTAGEIASAVLRSPLPTVRWSVSGDLLDETGELDEEYLEAIRRVGERKKGIIYTATWRDRKAEDLDLPITVNASCYNEQEVEDALDAGYEATIVVGEPEDATGTIAGRRVVQCPAQTRDEVTCASCLLCAKSYPNRPVIAFAAHGSRTKTVQKVVAEQKKS